MRLVKSLFIAITAVIMTTIAGSAFTHLFDETKDAQQSIKKINELLGNIVHAEETEEKQKIDIHHNANHTFTTSLNIHTPSTVIDKNDLPTPQTNTSQSPPQEGVKDESEYVDILAGLVPISSKDIEYENILGISIEELKRKLDNNVNIWYIAEQVNEVTLLENVYLSIYPVKIIEMFNNKEITQEMADILIEQSAMDIQNHNNTSIEVMINNMLTTD